jgi:prevent-host-death family protein
MPSAYPRLLLDIVAIIWLHVAMKSVGVAELKNNLSRHLRQVEAGEVFEITDHDRPIARLVPIESKGRLVVRPAPKPFEEIRDKVYAPLNLPFTSLELLREDRDRR